MMCSANVSRLLRIGLPVLLTALLVQAATSGAILTDKQLLGKKLFFDPNLSSPSGQSCASCHDPGVGFADPDTDLPTSEGIIPNRFGPRNAPTVTYLATAPPFTFDPVTGASRGGQFWDGRAVDLVDQAKGPFVNPIEMHSPNQKLVIQNIKKSDYVTLFQKVYGKKALNDVTYAYNSVADAIAEYEGSPELNKFNSKFDYFLAGQVQLTQQELDGLALFQTKGRCSICHVLTPNAEGGPPVFTSFGFANIGVPKNPDNLFYTMQRTFNPDGYDFVDEGVGAFLRDGLGQPESVYGPQLGKMGFPTVRNIAKTAPYFHNGVFSDLETVVHFFNVRDVPGSGFAPSEFPLNISQAVGNLQLTPAEEAAIVAFMETLTDDYAP